MRPSEDPPNRSVLGFAGVRREVDASGLGALRNNGKKRCVPGTELRCFKRLQGWKEG